MVMPRRIIAVITGVTYLCTSLFGILVALAAFAGHPPEWILDIYYSVFPTSAVGGVILVFVAIGLLSMWLFGLALGRIFRRQPTHDENIDATHTKTAPNNSLERSRER